MMNAFLAASLYSWLLCQNPMSKYEHKPTPSQPINITTKLLPTTKVIMKNTKRFK